MRLFSRFVFFKFIVKIYSFYLSAAKKIGWRPNKDNPVLFIFNNKMVHVVAVCITISLVFSNLTQKTHAITSDGVGSKKIILAQLVKSEFGSLEDDQLIEESFDETAYISPIQQNYLDNVAAVKSQPSIILDSGIDEPVLVEADLPAKPDGVRTEIVQHTVRPGDTISTIAQEYGVSVNTILWENSLSSYSIIKPGHKLAILPISGITHQVVYGDTLSSIARKYSVDVAKIMEANSLDDSSKLASGRSLMIPGGTKSSYVAAVKPVYSGISAIKDLVKAPSATPATGNMMNWPTEGHRITQYYSWRHNGLDIANKTGTPLYAADAGTVEQAQWGTGYGYQILINHGGGKKTRYAHMSKFYVKAGDKVAKGETIGEMGSTGWSTGPHIHFEVIINGVRYNPLNYIK